MEGGILTEVELNSSIRNIKGIGGKSEKLFNKLGIYTVKELLCFYPREYDIFGSIEPVSSVQEGRTVIIEAFLKSSPKVTVSGNLKITRAVFKDASGSIAAVWFNMPFMAKILRMGTHYILRGRIVNRNGFLELRQAKLLSRQEYVNLTGTLQPVYSLTAGLTGNAVAKAVKRALEETDLNGDFLPADIRKENNLILWKKAIYAIHFPANKEECIQARRRLVFDEFFLFALALGQLRKTKDKMESQFIMHKDGLAGQLLNSLPYKLTKAQQAAWQEIQGDLRSGKVMNRLVQGDVGSGKTIIALLSLLMAAENGFQGAIMAPTEVLAMQHYETFTGMLEPLGIKTGLLTGSLTSAQKKKVHTQIAEHEIDIIIGTHALVQEKVEFENLGLVVTDEQHRFGVKQREALYSKGKSPHMLVMSATPIPRTLAIILYSGLDVSVIDTMPEGRKPVKNCVVGTNYRQQAYRFMQKEIEAGHQVYIICPMVDESENMEAENVTEYYQMLCAKMPPETRISYLHGKMKPAQKNSIMEEFASHKTDILVSTTVIEVGINVPEATVMMIENSERFGLAQLHQLRGRVGRGSAQSYCIFMAGNDSKEVMERLSVIGNSNDGFYVAEQDLKMRGPGDFFGIRQSGMLDFQLADIYQDADILSAASKAAMRFKEQDIMEMCKKYGRLKEQIMSYTGTVFL